MVFNYVTYIVTAPLILLKEIWSALILRRLQYQYSSGPKLIEEAPPDSDENKENEFPDFDLYFDDDDDDDDDEHTDLNDHKPITNQFVEEGYVAVDDQIIWFDDAVFSLLENVKSLSGSLVNDSNWILPTDRFSYSGDYELLFFLTLLSFLVALTFRKTVKYLKRSSNHKRLTEKTSPVVESQEVCFGDTFISSINASDFESFGPVISKTDYEAPQLHFIEDDVLVDSRSDGSILDELIHRRQMIETASPSLSSLDLSRNLSNEVSSFCSNESPIELTVLSDDITHTLSEAEHPSVMFEAINRRENNENSIDVNVADSFGQQIMHLGNSEENRKENISRSSRGILEDVLKESERLHKLTEMAERLENFFSNSSNGLGDIIDYFEQLSGNENSSDLIKSSTTPIVGHQEIQSLEQLTKTLETPDDLGTDVAKEASISRDLQPTDQVLKQIDLPNQIILNEVPRKRSILKAVFDNSPAKSQIKSKSDSKIPVLSSSDKSPGRILHSPRPKSQKLMNFTISKPVLEYLLEPSDPDLDGYLTRLFDDDPKIVINTDLLESLSKENIDTLLSVYQGKETSENWKDRYDNFDILIGHLRLHLPQSLYTYFEEKIYDNMEDILSMAATTRSKLLEKVILFFREIVYYGSNYTLTDEFFVVLVHLLIPLTKSTSKFIHKLSLKSLCLMVQAIDITTFRRCFDLMFLEILSNKKLKGEKFACLFMIKFYLAANYNILKDEDTEDIIGKLIPLVSSLAIDSFQATRTEIVEIYLILEKKIPSSIALINFYEGFSNFLKSRVKKPEGLVNPSPEQSILLESF